VCCLTIALLFPYPPLVRSAAGDGLAAAGRRADALVAEGVQAAAVPVRGGRRGLRRGVPRRPDGAGGRRGPWRRRDGPAGPPVRRSEEHTSELQSREKRVCR